MSIEFVDIPPPEYVGDDESARELLRLSLRKIEEDPEDFIGWDTETHGKKMPIKKKPLDPLNDTVTYWSLSFKVGEIYRRWCISQEYFLYFSPLLESPGLNIAGWNLKYDAHIAYNCKVNIWNARRPVDGLVLAQLLDENRRSHGLKACAADWCGLHMTKYTSLFDGIMDAEGRKAREYETSLIELVELGHEDLVSNYASYDAYAHLRTVEWLIEKLSATPLGLDGNLWEYFLSIEMDFTELLWRMERRGMHVNTKYLESRIPIITKRINELEREINREAGYPINISSPKQLAKFFFDVDEGMGLEPVKMTATMQPSTDEEVLGHLADAGVEVAQLVVNCRKLIKSKSTYLDALIAMSNHFEDGRIHPNFKQMGARTGRLSTEHPNCVDGKTEVLTKSGWVRFDELQTWEDAPDMVASLVAQWVPETGAIEFVQADLIKQHYTGKMIGVKNQHIDLLMTPNHRCPLINRQTGKLQVLEASDYKEDKKQLHAGMYRRSDTAPMASLPMPQIAFLLAVQADGSWHDGGIDFGFNKKRKSDRLKKILGGIGAPYSFKEGGSAKYRFRVKASEHVKIARHILGGSKMLNDWVTMLSPEQLNFFCEEVFFWDGCWERKSMYASQHKTDADWVQLALTLCGKRAKVRKYKTPEGNADSWQVDVTNRDFSMTTNVKRSRRSWNDNVYCVSVPSGFFIVRRNGKACVTGNSQNFPRPKQDEWGIREAFTAPAGKKLIVADYEQVEMRIMADFSGDKTMMGAIMEGKDLHSFTVALSTPGVKYEEVVAAKKAGDDADDRQQWLQLQRQDKKAVGFGIIYGAGPPTISTQIEISEEDWRAKISEMPQKTFERRVTRLMKRNPLLSEEQAIEQVGKHSVAGDKIAEYFAAFPGVKGFMDQTPVLCRHRMYHDEENQTRDWDFRVRSPGAKPTSESGHSQPFGYVQTLCGRYRRLTDIDHKNYFYRSEAERQCVNTRIQGSAADITKAAMLRIEHHPKLQVLGVLVINQVHDEIVMEVPEENAEAAAPIIQHCMEHPFGDGPEDDALRVPIPVDLKICSNWAQAK